MRIDFHIEYKELPGHLAFIVVTEKLPDKGIVRNAADILASWHYYQAFIYDSNKTVGEQVEAALLSLREKVRVGENAPLDFGEAFIPLCQEVSRLVYQLTEGGCK